MVPIEDFLIRLAQIQNPNEEDRKTSLAHQSVGAVSGYAGHVLKHFKQTEVTSAKSSKGVFDPSA